MKNQWTKIIASVGIAIIGATAALSATPTMAWPASSSSSSSTLPAGFLPEMERPGAHATSGWQPTEYDTCSKQLHDSFSVVGADGKTYDTWHPTVVTDPDTGEVCTFGHEHGDDPTNSDIFEFVADKLAAPGSEAQAGVPFGLTSEASTQYAGEVHRHEDHVGHKIVVFNDIKLINADRTKGYVLDAAGEPIVCDYLMKLHQGSHSSDATKNNSHEIIYGAQCTDGTEMVVSHLTNMGNPNEFTQTCSDKTITTAGSDLPGSEEGRRRIPDLECLTTSDDIWATYETWEVVSKISTADGEVLAGFDPWFGIRNPSRYFDNTAPDPADAGRPMVELVKLFDEASSPWGDVTPGMDKNDPDSPFDGSQRDAYVAETNINNDGGPTIWYTDPYGGNASTTPFVGSVRQYIAATSNEQLPQLARQAFGFSQDHGAYGSGVHAPN